MTDPTHPLFGRRFPLVSLGNQLTRPTAHVLVGYRASFVLQIPLAATNLARAGVADRVEIIVGAALDTLSRLDGDFDLIFIDADKENNVAYVNRAVELGRPGTVIVVDNAVRAGRILDPAPEDHQARAVRDTLEMIGRHPALEAAAIQTLGAKGWDGVVIARVK